MRNFISTFFIIINFILYKPLSGQTCPTATGDQTTYGIGNVWIGYVYNNLNFTDYMGFVNAGNAGNPNFDQSFGGGNVNYPTSTCATNTETFSVRYKLQKTLAAGAYTFLIGGDDGVRLSIDGGLTYLLNDFSNHGYREVFTTIALAAGTYDFVLEYYEDGGGNRVRFDFTPDCIPVTTDQTSYGTGDVWRGITYSNINFTVFKGIINAGTAGNPNFDVNFGGSNTNFTTSDCPVLTETFSVRYKLNKNFPNGTYNITIGGDDGYRLSIDGGATFPYGNFTDHAYTSNTYNVILSGSTNLVYEFYENGGDNRVTFAINSFIPLPIELMYFTSRSSIESNLLIWSTASEKNNRQFEILESDDAIHFKTIATIESKAFNGNSNTQLDYSFIDKKKSNIYYKLKQIDFDGKNSESEIVYIGQNELVETINVYPNPVIDKINFEFTKSFKNRKIEICDLKGHMIERFQIEKDVTALEYNHKLISGIYLMKIINENKIEMRRLVIL
jgi:Secretion system C-terminal sorting domain/PA14 domain